MKPSEWNPLKAAGYGAFAGALFSIFNVISSNGYQSFPATYFVGYLIGGIVGGAFLFAVVAAIRNLFIK